MARATRITKIKFHSINRDVKAAVENGSYHAASIAKAHHVSDETVRNVRNAKTWPAFISAKQLKAATVARRKADAFEKAQAAAPKKRPLNPVQDVFGTDAQLSIDLRALEIAPITRKEFQELIEMYDSRFTTIYRTLEKKADKRVMPWNK